MKGGKAFKRGEKPTKVEPQREREGKRENKRRGRERARVREREKINDFPADVWAIIQAHIRKY